MQNFDDSHCLLILSSARRPAGNLSAKTHENILYIFVLFCGRFEVGNVTKDSLDVVAGFNGGRAFEVGFGASNGQRNVLIACDVHDPDAESTERFEGGTTG